MATLMDAWLAFDAMVAWWSGYRLMALMDARWRCMPWFDLVDCCQDDGLIRWLVVGRGGVVCFVFDVVRITVGRMMILVVWLAVDGGIDGCLMMLHALLVLLNISGDVYSRGWQH